MTNIQTRTQRGCQRGRESGFMLITTAIGLVVLIGLVGLAVDIGRIYIAKSEAQAFADSASLAATVELDGTMDGISRARARAESNPNLWNFNTSTFSNITISFSDSQDGPWVEVPETATGIRYARTSTSVDVPVYFLSLLTIGRLNVTSSPTAFLALSPSDFTSSVAADSGAGQQLKTVFLEGIFPFSPYAHTNNAPNFGLVPGNLYTLRWPANPRLGNNVCPGDNEQAVIDLAGAGGGSERGYIEETSARIIREAIVHDYQTVWRGIGSTVNMTGGAKQTERTALIERIQQDTNSTAPNYTSYVAQGTGNGRRIVAVPINAGSPSYTVVQLGAFFLLRATDYDNGGNSPWCAEYLGPYVQGSDHKGAADGAGAFVVRLND